MQVVVTQLALRPASGGSAIPAATRLLQRFEGRLDANDVVLLPELVGGDAPTPLYEAEVGSLARRLGAWVVGGSHFARVGTELANIGVVANPAGHIAGRFGKLNPYGDERAVVTKTGPGPLEFQIGDLSCLVMICADFWHANAYPMEGGGLDLILVPAFSASQRPTPQMARARWRHAAAARAYEQSAFVAVSDWAHPVPFGGASSSGVAGFADPNPKVPADLYRPLGRRRAGAYALAVDAVEELRADRRRRGFELATRHGGDGAR
jgi:predicted amidohydrolase